MYKLFTQIRELNTVFLGEGAPQKLRLTAGSPFKCTSNKNTVNKMCTINTTLLSH